MAHADPSAARAHEALRLAKTALERLERHETECLSFRREIRDALDRLSRQWWSAALGLIGVLVMALGYLLGRVLFPSG